MEKRGALSLERITEDLPTYSSQGHVAKESAHHGQGTLYMLYMLYIFFSLQKKSSEKPSEKSCVSFLYPVLPKDQSLPSGKSCKRSPASLTPRKVSTFISSATGKQIPWYVGGVEHQLYPGTSVVKAF